MAVKSKDYFIKLVNWRCNLQKEYFLAHLDNNHEIVSYVVNGNDIHLTYNVDNCYQVFYATDMDIKNRNPILDLGKDATVSLALTQSDKEELSLKSFRDCFRDLSIS
ncbi:hypothetical protein [Vibrio phage RYC]|nr:hypothetical protein [Vibrio phage RYC]